MAQLNPTRKRNRSISRNIDLELKKIEFSNFRGINNVDDAHNLGNDERVEAPNIDIDNNHISRSYIHISLFLL